MDNKLTINIHREQGTFLFKLHEECVFDVRLFNELLNEAILLCKSDADPSTRDAYRAKWFELAFECASDFCAHFNPSDGWSILNINEFDYTKALESLYWCGKSIELGKAPDYDVLVPLPSKHQGKP